MTALIQGQWVLRLDGSSEPDRALIGGKAASIASMQALGLRVPPAFVITTDACRHYLDGGTLPASINDEIDAGIAWLELESGRRFGEGPNPLLVSVRSGAPISMPGMMDTVLNLGINDETEQRLARECQDVAFAADSRRRFHELYTSIVLDSEERGGTVPSDVRAQLHGAIEAVFRSWNSRRARRYRDHHIISHALGTAVTVQAMVFGNMDARSGTGVLFSRNPISGEAKPYGEYLAQAQGEDVVSGQHTPAPVETMRETNAAALAQLFQAARLLEREANDAQDIEFTVERGVLYLLQTRVAKRAPRAAVRIAVDMVDEGRITAAQALARVSPEQVRLLLRPQLAEGTVREAEVLARGEAASPGVGVGRVVMDPDEAEACAKAGELVVLARASTSPNDLHGMIAAQAILTERGGSTSHAAVVGRALGRPCVVGCGDGALNALAGELVTVCGSTGLVYLGALAVTTPDERDDAQLRRIAGWAAEHSSVRVLPVAKSDMPMPIGFDGVLAECLQKIADLPPGAVVGGALFTNDEAALHAALEARVHTIVTYPVLPALLAAAHFSLKIKETQ